MDHELDAIRERLESISEELADLALSRLRATLDEGGTDVSDDEKRITRARRAVEKAVHILREAEHDES